MSIHALRSSRRVCLVIRKVHTREMSIISSEHEVRSPHPDIELPNCRVHELVWENVEKWHRKISIECGISGRKYTYREARERSRAIAAILQKDLRLNKGDCFAVISPNSTDYPLLPMAASEASVVMTTINDAYGPGEIAHQIADSNAKVVLTVASKLKDVTEAIQRAERNMDLILIADHVQRTKQDSDITHLDDILPSPSRVQVEERELSVDDDFLLLYSSGTTGLPKGVQITHRTLSANIKQNLSPNLKLFQDTTDRFQDVQLVQLPCFHAYGLNQVCMPALTVGAKLVTLPKFEPSTFINAIKNHKVSILAVAPPIALLLSSHPDATKEKLSTIRKLVCGAAPFGKVDAERLQERIPQAHYLQAYGMTETSPLTLLNIPSRRHKLASCGPLLPNTRAKIVDTTSGKPLPPGQPGELLLRGPQVMKGYLNKPEATKEIILEGGWLRTGDIAYYDEEGDFFIIDRLKELIKVKGLQVAPAELEEVLRTHPKISDAAVIGVPDDRAGEIPKAFVVVAPGQELSEQQVKNYISTHLAEFKHLKGGVVFLKEIPKSPSGKILRKNLRAEYGK